eukprot:14580985-Alexandrium_andersonii.AAC.1
MCIRDRSTHAVNSTVASSLRLPVSAEPRPHRVGRMADKLQLVCQTTQSAVSYTHLRAHETSAHL